MASVRTSRRSRASSGGRAAVPCDAAVPGDAALPGGAALPGDEAFPGGAVLPGDVAVNLAISSRRSSTAAAQISGSVSIGFGPQKDVSSSILCGDGDRDTPDTTDSRPTEWRLW